MLGAQDIAGMARKNSSRIIPCVGYGLFLATNATVAWGGVFPFIPMRFQTPDIISIFSITQSCVFAVSFFLSALGSYFFPTAAKRFLVWAACVPYVAGWCCLIAAMYLSDAALALSCCGGGFIGFGSAGFFMMWQRVFAAKKANEGNRELIVGTLIAPLIYFALYLIPIAVTTFLIPSVFLSLFGLCLVIGSREANLSQPMFTDAPHEHPQVYVCAVKDYWRSAVSVGSLAFACGVVRAIVLETPAVGSMVNMISMAALFASAGLMLIIWQFKPLRINLALYFRVFFPFVTTAFFILPSLGSAYASLLAGILYALFGCSIVLTMIQCAQASRDRGINPVFIYGIVAGIVYSFHDIGYIGGSYAREVSLLGVDPLAATAFLSIYLLGIMFFVVQGGFKSALSPSAQASKVELIPTSARALRNRPSAGAVQSVPANLVSASPYQDRLSKQCMLLQKQFKLSDREREIVEGLAHGNTVAGISELLGLSESTVRTHTRRLYAKLDVHKKQELLDLVQSFDPRALNDGSA